MNVLVLLLAWVVSIGAMAQNSRGAAQSARIPSYQVTGRVVDAETGEALELVNITFNDREFWAVTNEHGRFSLSLRRGTYTWSAAYLGYEEAKGTLKIDGSLRQYDLNIRLRPSSLALDEVSVTAREQAMGSSSVIDRMALQHLQPKSVEDILQLMPGSLTKNPDINSVGQAYLREVSGSNSNAMGTSVVVDGAPIGNDAVLQMLSASKSGSSLNSIVSSAQNTTGRGVDLRTISTDNIESMEVIRGIPSVEYGNLTSGVVHIKTKRGATPLEVKGKIDPSSKMVYMGKGFALGTGATVNLAVDYSESYGDIRFPAEGFERVTGDISYSQSFFREYPLSFNFKASYFQNLFDVRHDKQQRTFEITENKNRGIRLNLNGDWNIKQPLVSNLSYNLSLNYSNQYAYELQQVVLSTGATPVAVSLVPGEFQSYMLNGTYTSEHTVSGEPLAFFAQVKGNRVIFFNDDFTMAFKEGFEYRYDVNHGAGLEFDPSRPPFVRQVQTVRPRPYYDIPAMQTLSGFFENKSIFPLASTSMTLQAGLRANYLFIDRNYLDRSNMFTLEPRVNAEWTILNPKNSVFDNLSINAGWGLTSKMPPLAYLYPDKAYFDDKSFSYIDPSMSMDKSIAVMTTAVIENTSNPEIKPSTGRKLELGFNFTYKKMSGNVTYFMEKYDDELSYRATPYTFTYRSYNPPAGAENYRYTNGTLYCDKNGSTLVVPYYNDSVFESYNIPMNSMTTEKRGIEYSFNFGQINSIRTSLVVDGAWLWVKRRSQRDYWSTISETDPVTDGRTNRKRLYPFQVCYPAGSGSIESRVNTNFRFITHIPSLSMIFTTTAQVVWREWNQSIWQDDAGNDVWYMDVNRLSPTREIRPFVDPVGFRDYAGNYYKWTTEYRDLDLHRREYSMIQSFTYSTYFDREIYPSNIIFNFRLTKQFGDTFEFSFMANNLFNTRHLYRSSVSGGYVNLSIPQYFGAELKLKI